MIGVQYLYIMTIHGDMSHVRCNLLDEALENVENENGLENENHFPDDNLTNSESFQQRCSETCRIGNWELDG